MGGRGRRCRCRSWCCDSDQDASSSSSSSGSDSDSEHGTTKEEVLESEWWQEREFDSMFFAPGMFTSGSARDMTRALESDEAPTMTGSMKAQATELPDPAPLERDPLWQEVLPGITIEWLKKRLESEPFLFVTAFVQELAARDVEPSRWQEGIRIPGTQLRGVKFKMPVPADIPGFLKRMVAIPDFADVRALFRMRVGSERVDIVQQTITMGVPMGDAFRVQVTHSFQADAGKVRYSKWVDVVWLKSVMGMIKTYVTQQTETSGRKGAEVFKQVLQTELKERPLEELN